MMKRILSSRGLLLAALLGLASAFGWGAISRADADHAASVGSPETPRASLALGYSGDEPQIRAAQDAVHRQPDSAAAYARLALSMLQRKRETANPAYLHYAIDALDAARALDPQASEVLLARILVAHEQHRFEEARKLARQLIAREPHESTGHLLLGDAHLELGDYQAALTTYQTAIDLRPDLRSYNRAAHLRWLHGNVEGAIDLLELAIEAGSPRDPEAMAWCYVDLGEIYRKLGDGKRALRAAQRARKLVTDYRPALVLEARARLLLGDGDKAVKLLERAVAHHPRVADLLLLSELGQRGRLAEAEALADEDPRPLAFYYARHGLQPERALALAERELEARHGIEAHAVHALALIRAGRPRDAARAVDRALVLGTPDAELHVIHALSRLAVGDRDEARAALGRALALHPDVDRLLVAEVRRALGKEAP